MASGKRTRQKDKIENPSFLDLTPADQRYKLVSEVTNQGIWEWNTQTGDLYYSPIWKKQIGYKDHELPNDFSVWVDHLHPEEREEKQEAVAKYLANPKGNFLLEFRFRHKKGHYIWIRNNAAPQKDKEGNVIRLFGAHSDITNEKKTEEELRSRSRLFETVFQNSPLGKSITAVGGSLRTNMAFARILGYTMKEMTDMNWQEITHPDDIAQSAKVVETLLKGKRKRMSFEKRYKHKKGYYVWTEVHTTLVRNDDQTPAFFITSVSDITKRKEDEKEIRESEARYRTLAEASKDMIFIINDKMKILYVNEAGANAFRRMPNELIGNSIDEVFSESNSEGQRESLQKVFTTGISQTQISEVTFPTGSIFLETTLVPLRKSGKKIIEVMGVSRDITSRIEMEEERIRFFDISQNLLCTANYEGYFTQINGAFEKLLGYSREELLAIPFIDLVHPDDRDKTLDEVKKLAEGINTVNFINRYRAADGSYRILKWSTTPYKNLLYAAATDITEEVSLQESLENSLEKTRQSNRDLEQFAYVASHDLQEPLRMVSSYTRLLEKKYMDHLDDDASKYIYYIVDGASRMQQLIEDLLSFSRITTKGKPFESIDMNEILHQVYRLMQSRIDETYAQIQIDPLPEIWGDPTQIERLFRNILNNALKFNDKEKPEITVSANKSGKNIIFSIRDNGIGIQAGNEERIFNIFQRLHSKKEYPGTGIGLAICKRIVERHNGSIWFESKSGSGTTFFISLPVKQH